MAHPPRATVFLKSYNNPSSVETRNQIHARARNGEKKCHLPSIKKTFTLCVALAALIALWSNMTATSIGQVRPPACCERRALEFAVCKSQSSHNTPSTVSCNASALGDIASSRTAEDKSDTNVSAERCRHSRSSEARCAQCEKSSWFGRCRVSPIGRNSDISGRSQ